MFSIKTFPILYLNDNNNLSEFFTCNPHQILIGSIETKEKVALKPKKLILHSKKSDTFYFNCVFDYLNFSLFSTVFRHFENGHYGK